ncbi:MAG: hypothetical protein MZV64_27300 [Ignavibacteriales bacterium]|nr:hypothetical protein [Ignavibacteriales bacterium]
MICGVQGCLTKWETPDPDHSKNVGDELVKYFNVAKNCSNTTNMDCWAAFHNNLLMEVSNDTTVNSYDTFYKFITTNGMAYVIKPVASCNFDLSR